MLSVYFITFAGIMSKISYTKGEERANYLSHGAGIAMGIVVGICMMIFYFDNDDLWVKLGVWLYLVGMLGSYVASTVYHACPHGSKWREILRKWDHAAIYWHIAGSYSPITLTAMRDAGLWGWGLFSFVWLCALAGTIVSFRKLKAHSNMETICFVLMGMVILVAFKPLLDTVSTRAVVWIVGEGVCYVTGALFYSLHKRKYMHSVFHLFVLGGSVCHIIAVWDILKNYLA